ncbi:hypothetical protein Theba_1670 [Mesotoga prima MesG1.Ag.4.2]|uniref:Uncharacterized protein n=1 Tax=Mesotoga prima MesG1.Ag.4.2 TaxID=660470 RepID=I2F5X9_9BACT|nr:hypothetical protein Theba_1670 [Mesotoga prima MesG1.Ag.4.2]
MKTRPPEVPSILEMLLLAGSILRSTVKGSPSSEETKSRSDAAFSGKHSEAGQKARIIAASEGFAFASTTSREKNR